MLNSSLYLATLSVSGHWFTFFFGPSTSLQLALANSSEIKDLASLSAYRNSYGLTGLWLFGEGAFGKCRPGPHKSVNEKFFINP